jgi:nucleotide-binding universal stress UspA family protein
MTPITRILCPVDLSDCSRHALDHAFAIARHYRATIAALFVVPPATALIPAADLGTYPLVVFTAEELAQLRGELEQFVKRDAGDVAFTVEVADGNVVAEIVARASAADLVVLGTHGRTGLERLMLGSVTERVLVKTARPVLTVPPRAPAAIPATDLFTRILCAVDFSPASMKALEAAATLAKDLNATLSVAHVLERFPIDEPVMMGEPGTPEHDRVASELAGTRLRENIPDSIRTLGPLREVVAEGKAYREILRLAEQERSELIVMGAHRSGGGPHTFGSTTNQVVRRATCPVLTLKG